MKEISKFKPSVICLKIKLVTSCWRSWVNKYNVLFLLYYDNKGTKSYYNKYCWFKEKNLEFVPFKNLCYKTKVGIHNLISILVSQNHGSILKWKTGSCPCSKFLFSVTNFVEWKSSGQYSLSPILAKELPEQVWRHCQSALGIPVWFWIQSSHLELSYYFTFNWR